MAGVIDESAHPASFFAQRLERKAEQQREQQNLKNVAFGEGADGAVGDDVEQEIDAAVSGGRMDIFGDGGGVRRAGEAGARFEQIADKQADRQREGRDDLEIDQRLDPDAPNLARIFDMGHARHHRAEDDGRDHHFDQLDEAVAQRLHPGLGGEVGSQPAKQRAQRNGDKHLDIEVMMQGLFASGAHTPD